ncbi:ATP-dependent DNA helicase RecG [Francisella frigiditurris]|uniref:ATP-dependent DNA helicase RecG n=1 Tax=Francisella frigiditurris TaxID=1542390 RepID=A0A1J0KS42_9GAMM|nr:ATP-dependent DNA helicase RecG [Francisella frigiditurris]
MNFLDFTGIGEKTLKIFNKYGLNKPNDLLTIFPKDYKDTTNVTAIESLISDQKALIEGSITNLNVKKFGKKLLSFVVNDGTGYCQIILFKFYPNQVRMLENAESIRCYGKISFSNGVQMIHPEWAIIKDGKCTLEKKVSPIYGLTKISNKLIVQIISEMVSKNQVFDLLPNNFVEQYSLMNFSEALSYIHVLTNTFDKSLLPKARYSIKFEEMLAYKLAEENIRKDFNETISPLLEVSKSLQENFFSKLPYTLTKAQQKAMEEILSDIKEPKTMIRLLQGDVGAGKTIVATLALYVAAKSGYQAAIMAPTEILAEQHYAFLSSYLAAFNIEVIPLLGKLTAKQIKENLRKIAMTDACVIVGTHAIFQDRVIYKNLGLVIVDEQHRFGVEQRLALVKKAKTGEKVAPHQLIISATPIPRTLAMTLYGNLQLSILDELPPSRKKIVTTILNRSKKQILIDKLKKAISKGEQIYWVCPLVEESESLDSLQDVKSLYQELCSYLEVEAVGLVYGSMKSKEKIEVMDDFKAGKYSILVATTVIEVGVDVPNATIMIIDNAERLGLSQLHQLRGRVGRGSKESYCVLLYSDKISEVGKRRLSLIRESQDGFYLAEQDLKIRGAGDILGKEQSGVSTFRTFDINEYYENYETILEATDSLKKEYPEVVPKIINRWFDRRVDYVDV